MFLTYTCLQPTRYKANFSSTRQRRNSIWPRICRYVVMRVGIDLILTTQLQFLKITMLKVQHGYALDDVEITVWNAVRHVILDMLKTDFCDANFKALDIDQVKKQAACCRVRVVKKEYGFCAFIHVLNKHGVLTQEDFDSYQKKKAQLDELFTQAAHDEWQGNLKKSRFLVLDSLDCGASPSDICSRFVSCFFTSHAFDPNVSFL